MLNLQGQALRSNSVSRLALQHRVSPMGPGEKRGPKITSFSLKTECLLEVFEIIGEVEQLSSFSNSLYV